MHTTTLKAVKYRKIRHRKTSIFIYDIIRNCITLQASQFKSRTACIGTDIKGDSLLTADFSHFTMLPLI
jgi:hypothetical protein